MISIGIHQRTVAQDIEVHRLKTLNIALKEWSATIDALASGDQLFLLRKGGIRETNRHFEMTHRRFLLYPTHFHEAGRLLKPEFRDLVDTDTPVAGDAVTFTAWAEVADVLSVNHAEQLEALSSFHVWTDEFMNKRIAWKPRHAADLIVLRTHKLINPVDIPIAPHHKGCKSWVDIEPSIDVGASIPAMPDAEWEKQATRIRMLLSETTAKSIRAT